MITKQYDFNFKRGDTCCKKIGANVEIEFEKMFITAKDENDNLIFQKCLGNGITKQDGYYLLKIEPEDTKDVEFEEGTRKKKLFWDMEISVLGEIHTPYEGKITLTKDVTTHEADEEEQNE